MRTLVISDLHLGCGITPGSFAGAVALAGLLAELARGPLRIVLNGDTFDFIAQEPYDASEPPQLSGRVPIEGALSTGILDIFAQALAGRGERSSGSATTTASSPSPRFRTSCVGA